MKIRVFHHAHYQSLNDHVWVIEVPQGEGQSSLTVELGEMDGVLPFSEEAYIAAYKAAMEYVDSAELPVEFDDIEMQPDNGRHYEAYGSIMEQARERARPH